MAKVKYQDLSTPLKWAIAFAWIFGVIETLYFIAGFVIGVAGL